MNTRMTEDEFTAILAFLSRADDRLVEHPNRIPVDPVWVRASINWLRGRLYTERDETKEQAPS